MASTKKEIDKELMYKKLMPTNPRSLKITIPELEETTPPPAPTPTPAPDPQPLKHQTQLHRQIGIPILDTQKTILVNTTESIVTEKLDSVLARFKCCKCDRCKKDIVAIALNRLPPKYMVLAEGQPVPQISTQENAQVVSAIIHAVITVRSHARH